MKRAVLLFIFALVIIGCSSVTEKKIPIQVLEHSIVTDQGDSLSIALLSDFHFDDNPDSLRDLDSLLIEIRNRQPDLITLAGDYIKTRDKNPRGLIRKIVKQLSSFSEVAPTFAVLGNHDNWSGRTTWIEEFEASPIILIENKTSMLNKNPCIRGGGDYSSGYYTTEAFYLDCTDSLKITLTHDPFAAFAGNHKGIVLAGHTHCGQIHLPLIGAPWTPTKAPTEAQCGLFTTENMALVVSGGLGTSIVPFRFGTEAHWNFLKITRI